MHDGRVDGAERSVVRRVLAGAGAQAREEPQPLPLGGDQAPGVVDLVGAAHGDGAPGGLAVRGERTHVAGDASALAEGGARVVALLLGQDLDDGDDVVGYLGAQAIGEGGAVFQQIVEIGGGERARIVVAVTHQDACDEVEVNEVRDTARFTDVVGVRLASELASAGDERVLERHGPMVCVAMHGARNLATLPGMAHRGDNRGDG